MIYVFVLRTSYWRYSKMLKLRKRSLSGQKKPWTPPVSGFWVHILKHRRFGTALCPEYGWFKFNAENLPLETLSQKNRGSFRAQARKLYSDPLGRVHGTNTDSREQYVMTPPLDRWGKCPGDAKIEANKSKGFFSVFFPTFGGSPSSPGASIPQREGVGNPTTPQSPGAYRPSKEACPPTPPKHQSGVMTNSWGKWRTASNDAGKLRWHGI